MGVLALSKSNETAHKLAAESILAKLSRYCVSATDVEVPK